MSEVPARSSYYRDYVTPEAWQELRRWLVASMPQAGTYEEQAKFVTAALSKMDELVAPVPRVLPAQQPRVEHGVNLGGVFIPEAILGELMEHEPRNSDLCGEEPVLLERNAGEALAKYGLAVQETRGGWHRTELLEEFMKNYESARLRKEGKDGTASTPE